jgi:hypothetical protein
MVAAVTAAVDSHPFARGLGERPSHRRGNSLLPDSFESGKNALGIGLGLLADCLEAGDAFFQRFPSSAWPEQFVEKITEPRFEYVDLGIRGRHARGLIVHHAPRLDIVFDRSADAWPWTGNDVDVVGQGAGFGSGTAR